MKFNFKLNLKVSAFYLEKQKKVLFLKNIFLSCIAKIDPKDGISRLNFPEGFGCMYLHKLAFVFSGKLFL